MRTDIYIEPESEEEYTFIEMLAQAREYALEEAELEPTEAARLFMFYAYGLTLDEFEAVDDSDDVECPECGEPIFDADAAGIGGDLIAKPCGHEVGFDDVPEEFFID